MKKLSLIVGFIASLQLSNVQATSFHFDGTLDLYTGPALTDSANVVGDFSFTGEPYNSDFTGMFDGNLFGLPVTGNLTIPNGIKNPVFSPFSISWNGNDFSGGLLIEVSFTSLELFQITTLDGDNDGVPGSIFSIGPNQSTSLALSGQFSAVPLPSALWLFGSGLIGLIGLARRKV